MLNTRVDLLNAQIKQIIDLIEKEVSKKSLITKESAIAIVEPKPKARRNAVAKVPNELNKALGTLIGTYITAWQDRYRTKARPDVTRAYGVFKKLLESRSTEELVTLLQVYCQMNDEWFGKKHHDVVTFYENIGKVAVAADKGHECGKNGERSWMDIVREQEEAEKNARKRIQSPD